jgi:hypothetical protein
MCSIKFSALVFKISKFLRQAKNLLKSSLFVMGNCNGWIFYIKKLLILLLFYFIYIYFIRSRGGNKFQPPNPSITASKSIPRFWSFGRFVWKSKKLPNFFIFEKLLTFLFCISWFGYLRVRHVEFSSNLFLVWIKIEFLEISSEILYGKFSQSRISRNNAKNNEKVI